MDRPLREALGYRAPPAPLRALRAGLRLRGRAERVLPARRTPVHVRDLPRVRSCPAGFEVEDLGTFPRGCPVARRDEGRPAADATGRPS